jgi:hypothetical protein
MAALNIARLTTLNGKLALANVTTVPTTVLSNSANSNSLVKINTVSLSNYSNVSANVSLEVVRNSLSYSLAAGITIPTTAALIAVSKDSMIYLEEGDDLRVYSGANNSISAVISYDFIS